MPSESRLNSVGWHDNRLIGKDLEGSDSDLIELPFRNLSGGTVKHH
jgi:hypothetical protein